MNEARTTAEARAAPGGRGFREALRKAGDRAAAGAPGARRGEGPHDLPARRADADRKDRTIGERRERFREEERSALPAPPAATSARVDEPASAELRALLRSLPLAIDASRVREGAPLSLSFGRALGVDIRPGPAGVEIVIRSEHRLARTAAAELPGLVAALRARGVAVARAEVRARGAAPVPGGSLARVDAAAPLR